MDIRFVLLLTQPARPQHSNVDIRQFSIVFLYERWQKKI